MKKIILLILIAGLLAQAASCTRTDDKNDTAALPTNAPETGVTATDAGTDDDNDFSYGVTVEGKYSGVAVWAENERNIVIKNADLSLDEFFGTEAAKEQISTYTACELSDGTVIGYVTYRNAQASPENPFVAEQTAKFAERFSGELYVDYGFNYAFFIISNDPETYKGYYMASGEGNIPMKKYSPDEIIQGTVDWLSSKEGITAAEYDLSKLFGDAVNSKHISNCGCLELSDGSLIGYFEYSEPQQTETLSYTNDGNVVTEVIGVVGDDCEFVTLLLDAYASKTTDELYKESDTERMFFIVSKDVDAIMSYFIKCRDAGDFPRIDGQK